MNSAPDVVGAYAAAYAEYPRDLARALVRTKSRSGREVLAALVGGRRISSAELEEIGRNFRRSHLPGDFLDPALTALYARVIAVQTDDPSDRAAALGLLQWVLAERPAALGEREATVLLQLALKERDFNLADSVIRELSVAAGAGRLAAADLANPWVRPGVGDEHGWLKSLNTALYGPEIVQAALLPSGDTPFDRLTTASHQRIAHALKVTAVISCYNPDRHLLTAVRSVVDQTWQNFELFVVDDASPAPLPGVLEEVERMDPRVRVIRKAVNGGTYRARNTALRYATGDFFTCLDSDDWAHPQRLELGVLPMLEDESLVATRSMGVRATEHMELSRVGYGGRFKAASSLMVRTVPVVNRLGFFDPVRKAADNEYALRVEAAFDGKVVDIPNYALTVLLADAASLSASDYSSGWRHPARSEYSESYSEWHRQVQWRDATMFLRPHGPRPFPAPRRWERHPQDGPPGPTLDAVILADWRENLLSPGTLKNLRAYVAEGRRVGIIHHESLIENVADEQPVARPVRELIRSGAIERVYLDDARHSELSIIADPRIIQFPPSVVARLTSTRVIAVSDAKAETARQYSRTSVAVHAKELLGAAPEWVDGQWPQVPAATRNGAPLTGGGTIHLRPNGQPATTGDLISECWLVREPGDGERAALLSVIRRAGTGDGADLRVLFEAWAAGDEPWERTVTRWLERTPGTWAVSVQATSEVRVVVASRVRAEITDAETIRLQAIVDGSATLILWRGGESLHRPVSA